MRPSRRTSRRTTRAPVAVRSSELTSTRSADGMNMPTRPSVVAESMRIGEPNVRPPSCENATCVFGVLPTPVNHATAAALPVAVMTGPFTGQPLISQLSRANGDRRRPLAIREPHDGRVANLLVAAVAVRDEHAAGRTRGRRLAALADARIDHGLVAGDALANHGGSQRHAAAHDRLRRGRRPCHGRRARRGRHHRRAHRRTRRSRARWPTCPCGVIVGRPRATRRRSTCGCARNTPRGRSRVRASAQPACRRQATNSDGKSAQLARKLVSSAIVTGSSSGCRSVRGAESMSAAGLARLEPREPHAAAPVAGEIRLRRAFWRRGVDRTYGACEKRWQSGSWSDRLRRGQNAG